MRLIDADALKEWVENWFTKNRLYHPYAKKNDIPITELYDILEQMPTIEERNIGKWIPCSERLPSEGENVLICDTLFGNVAIGKLIRYNTNCCWEVDHWDCDIEDWQAWMPLPEPWRGEEHDEVGG